MRTVLIPVALVLLIAAGCAGGDGASGDGRLRVVAAFFPLAEAARQVGGIDVDVRDLTPAGVEPHDLELSTREVDAILDADLVIVLGGGFQPGVEDVAEDRDGPTIDVFDALGLGDDDTDPHIWLDPTVMSAIADLVADELGGDASTFTAELQALDDRYREALAPCRGAHLVAAHDAFGRLADRYGLVAPAISGLVPEEEPDPTRLDDLAELIDREGVTTVFTEPLLPKRAAETLAQETGTTVATLDPLESDPGVGYIEAMDRNLDALRSGLTCGR